MDIEKLVGFLGHASINEDFDDFLILNNIKKRPKSYDTRIVSVNDLSLVFEDDATYMDNYLTPSRSQGVYLFVEIEIDKKYTGKLPYGITFDMQPEALFKIFGPPLMGIAADVSPSNPDIPFFLKDNLMVGARFVKDKKDGGKTMQWLKFFLPSKYNHKRYGFK